MAQPPGERRKCDHITWHEGGVSRERKDALLGQKSACVWLTGLSGSGKSTVACTVEHALLARGCLTSLLDGDNIRHGLNANLGFSAEDRAENIRRIGEVAKLLVDSGVIALTSFISPYVRDREAVRARLAEGDFIEVYMDVPLAVCEARDCKGLYKLARAGKIKGFTGIDDPYEAPVSPELVLRAHDGLGRPVSPECMAAQVLDYLEVRGFIPPAPPLGLAGLAGRGELLQAGAGAGAGALAGGGGNVVPFPIGSLLAARLAADSVVSMGSHI